MTAKALFFILMFFSILSYSQNRKLIVKNDITTKTEWKFTYKNGKETKVKESATKYDSSGNTIEIKEFDKTGDVKKHVTYEYNGDNDKTLEKHYSAEGKLKKEITYLYKNELRTQKIIYDPEGNITSKKVYEFN